MVMFPKFDACACEGDAVEVEHEGFKLVATIYRDDDGTPPWKRHDGHGPVTDWVRRDPKKGELLLLEDGGSSRYYDMAEAKKIALRDGWGANLKGNPNQRAAAAARADFEAMKAWCGDEWFWCGVAVTVSKAGIELIGRYDSALWGIECNYPGSDNSYLSEVASELSEEALELARGKLKLLCAA